MNQGSFNKLSNILQGENKLVIPDLQRDYCWGTYIPKVDNKDKKSLVYKFTDELIKESFNQKTSKEYSYGILYTYAYPESFLHLCDGQQRLTTLYLILGILNCHCQNQQLIDMLQLENGLPRLKYEVRNSTDYFIKELLKNVFLKQDKTDLENLSNANWFRNEYDNDPSILSLVAAVKDINKLISKGNSKEVADFILTKVGFVYIKLEAKEEVKESNFRIREYGEKMYEIVNTTGDPMEFNEHKKSIILSQVDENHRFEETEKWEVWQDFFWQNRGVKCSADEGFNEFLKWIDVIEGDSTYTIDVVEEYFKAFFLLINIQEKLLLFRDYKIVNIKEEFIKNQKLNTVVLYPCLIYLKNTNCVKYENNAYTVNNDLVAYDELFRYIRFFSNISKITDASNESIQLAKQIGENRDVVHFINTEHEKFKKILTDEEIFKLSLLKRCQSEIIREEYESAFWTLEDFPIMDGKVEFILESIGIPIKYNVDKEFDLGKFIRFSRHFQNLFLSPGDLLRRALLTFGEYQIWDGYSTNLDMHRYNFGGEEKHWRVIVSHPNTKGVIVLLLRAFENDNELTKEEYKSKLNGIINECIKAGDIQDWRMIFINNSKNMDFCKQKRACINEQQVVLLENKRVNSPSTIKKLKIVNVL